MQGGVEYVDWAASFATGLDIGVPWIMCQQADAPTSVINTCNGFYCDNWLPGHFQSFPSEPAMWTENWPGWFQKWGEPKPRRPVQDVAFAVARWFARGGSMQNYYMWHGGTTFARDSGGPFIVTSYDYDVMLDEYALVREPKYSHTTAMHAVLHAAEAIILGQDPPAAMDLGTNLEAHVYGTLPSPGSASSPCFAFMSNVGTADAANVTFNGQSYHLPAWSVSLLPGCATVAFNTAQIGSQYSLPTMRRRDADAVAAPRGGQVVGWAPEPIGVVPAAPTVATAGPAEQLDTANFTTDYMWYQVAVPAGASGTQPLVMEAANDVLYVWADDAYVGTVQSGAPGR